MVKLLFDTIKLGWFIVSIEGSQVIISKKNIFLSLKIDFVSANSADCLTKYPFWGFGSSKG